MQAVRTLSEVIRFQVDPQGVPAPYGATGNEWEIEVGWIELVRDGQPGHDITYLEVLGILGQGLGREEMRLPGEEPTRFP